MSTKRRIEPGSTIGVLGGGQLGRMFTHAAQRLGYRVIIFTPEYDSPASQVANDSVIADYEDLDAIRKFSELVDVVTIEFENIPLRAVEKTCEKVSVFPGLNVLAVAQHRIREKTTLQQFGFPVTPFVVIEHEVDLISAGQQLGWPLILKTAMSGYDGKGQRLVHSLEDSRAAFRELGSVLLIAEKKIDFDAEVSILAARNAEGSVAVYPILINQHAHHILDVTRCAALDEPSSAMQRIAVEAEEIVRGVLQSLECIGLLCIEFFVSTNGTLLINEIAPRPHNSGHLTIEACRTSQFEQQLRAVCNLPLGETELKSPAAMVNLLGNLWSSGVPSFEVALREPNCFLHLYGKGTANAGRKMGHITCLAETADLAAEKALRIRNQSLGSDCEQ